MSSQRCIALVGPHASGKTTLFEALLFRTGAIDRRGSVNEGNTVGDASPQARAHAMSVEPTAAWTEYLGDRYCFIDCPGSVDFAHEAQAVLAACDAAVVVCEPDAKKVPAVQLILKQLEALNVPRFLFINKIDRTDLHVRDVLAFLQPASATPIVLRHIPIWRDETVIGFVDLALERAFIYRDDNRTSEVISLPQELKDREQDARFEMLEKLADYDDALMEQLLSDMEPPRDQVFSDLSANFAQGLITPALIGSAEHDNGISRLLKALRHEAPDIARTRRRHRGQTPDREERGATAQVMKTFYTPHGGKVSLARVLDGTLHDSDTVTGKDGQDTRIAGLFSVFGSQMQKISRAEAGDTVALGRLEAIGASETIATGAGACPQLIRTLPPQPVFAMAVSLEHHKDEVKLADAMAKILEEDPALEFAVDPQTHEMVLWGQGEMHLRIALERLQSGFGIAAGVRPRRVAYKETIRGAVTIRGRHKKQSGGHGQFGDVVLDIKPLPRGGGFRFSDTVTGGAVPRQYIPAVEAGVRDFLECGPLGFPVVDLEVTLTDGSHHSVDSSEMAFRLAGRLAMSLGMPQCKPVLLEPILAVEIHTPNDATSKINQIVSSRRGQLLGFDARPGWPGWDTVQAQLPEAEAAELIVEIRSATAGVGSFAHDHDHLQELTGRAADQVVEANRTSP